MKILLISHLIPYPPRGGCSLRNYNLIKECSRNHEIYMVSFYRKTHVRGDISLDDSIREMKKYCKDVKVFKIPSEHNRLLWYLMLILNLFSLAPYSAWMYHSSAMIKAVKNMIKQYKFDVMEIGEIGLLKYARYAPSIPKVLVHHNIESQLLFRRSRAAKNPLAKLYLAIQAYKLKRYERLAGDNIDYHTTVSQIDKETLLRINSKANIAVIPNGVDTEYFKPMDIPIEKNNLVFVGGMSWLPNLDAMVYFKDEIWPLLKARVPDIKMTVIGAGPSRELINYSKRDPMFQVKGFVDDVRPFIAKAAVYVVPIRIGGGTRLKILDAMAMGKAIVSMSIGCEGIEAVDGKDIIVADEPEVFAEKIIALLTDEQRRQSIEKSARQNVENKYAWGKIGPHLEDVYYKLAKKEH